MAYPDMKRLDELKNELQRTDSNLSKTLGLLRPPPTEQETGVPRGLPPERTMGLAGLQGPSPERAMGPPPDMSGRLGPQVPTTLAGQLSRQKVNLNNVLFREPDSPAVKALTNLAERSGQGVGQLTYGDIIKDFNQAANIGLRSEVDTIPLATGGGLLDLAAGGEFSGRVPGDGGGMEDNVRMPIKEEGEDVGVLAVSPKEYVVDSHTMSALGNGNPDEGADIMDEFVENIREEAFGTREQPNEIDGLASLQSMLERV